MLLSLKIFPAADYSWPKSDGDMFYWRDGIPTFWKVFLFHENKYEFWIPLWVWNQSISDLVIKDVHNLSRLMKWSLPLSVLQHKLEMTSSDLFVLRLNGAAACPLMSLFLSVILQFITRLYILQWDLIVLNYMLQFCYISQVISLCFPARRWTNFEISTHNADWSRSC